MHDLPSAITSTAVAATGVAATASFDWKAAVITALTTIIVAAVNAFAYNRSREKGDRDG